MVVKNKTELSGEQATDILIKSTSREQKKKYMYVAVIFVIGVLSLIIGLVMKELAPLVKGKADMSLVNQIIKKNLENL